MSDLRTIKTRWQLQALIAELEADGVLAAADADTIRDVAGHDDGIECVNNAAASGPAVSRKRVTDATKQDFRDARSAGDQQTQLDILFEIVTGETP